MSLLKGQDLMHYPFIRHLFGINRQYLALVEKVHAPVRVVWDGLEHLWVMDTQRLSGLGLEPVLTTRELAEYLGVNTQAIYDLRTDGRGPSGIRVGREIRFRVSDVLEWLDGLHEPARAMSRRDGER